MIELIYNKCIMARPKKQNILYHYRIVRSQVWRARRMLFMSPAEARFIEMMGGRVLVVEWFVSPLNNNYPLTIVLSMGKLLRREKVRREVRVGKCFIDFGNDIRRGIEIDGRDYHQDVLKEQARNEYVAEYGWRLLHIQAGDMYRSPDYVKRKVIAFLCD